MESAPKSILSDTALDRILLDLPFESKRITSKVLRTKTLGLFSVQFAVLYTITEAPRLRAELTNHLRKLDIPRREELFLSILREAT
jgi:hypothetical protein